jgi:hypothetical protein
MQNIVRLLYVRKTWSGTLRKNVDRRYEENWMRRKVFGLKREEVTGV